MYLKVLSVPKCLTLESHQEAFRKWLLKCKVIRIPTIESDQCIGSLILETTDPHNYSYTISSAMWLMNQDKVFKVLVCDIQEANPNLRMCLDVIPTTKFIQREPTQFKCVVLTGSYQHGRSLIPFNGGCKTMDPQVYQNCKIYDPYKRNVWD